MRVGGFYTDDFTCMHVHEMSVIVRLVCLDDRREVTPLLCNHTAGYHSYQGAQIKLFNIRSHS